MKSLTRLLLLPILGLALIAASATAVAAQTDSGESETAAATHRPGLLRAKGVGSVELDVDRGRVAMGVIGDVTIVGPSDLVVRVNGARAAAATEGGQTVVVLDDFSGRIVVRGTDYEVSIDGRVRLRGVGHGQAQFVGTGWWKTRHDQGRWPAQLPQTAVGFGTDAG